MAVIPGHRQPCLLNLRTLVSIVAAVLLACCSPAWAASTPSITLDKKSPAKVLYGTTAPVTLTAANPAGQPEGYNLSFRDVLPAGVSLASTPSLAPDQTIPGPGGTTTLVWLNVSDLSPGSSFTISYSVQHDAGAMDVPSSYTNTSQALINTDPRIVPKVNSDGTAQAGSYTGDATDSATTTLAAIEIRKGEPSPEGEIPRGVHDHQTTYTLTVTNNNINPTTNVVVDDYLPAALEFLACGDVDNTTGPEEYPGSGPLDGNSPAPPGCVAPGLVETVNLDPDGAGPLAAGIYTHVRWTSAQIPALASLSPTSVVKIPYLAGIPIQANTMTFTGGTPGTNGAQTANLDNNNGAETTDEQLLRNGAAASGTYNGTTPTSDSTTLDRTAEDLRLIKTVTPTTFVNGDIVNFTLDVATSEYRNLAALRLTDTLPSGLCPLGASNFETTPPAPLAECNPILGQGPSLAYTSATEQANGSFLVVWDNTGGLTSMPASTNVTITFPARVRRFYQQSFTNAGALNSNDGLTNTADITGTGTVPSGQPHPDRPSPETIVDASGASISARGPSIDKQVAENEITPMDCAAAGLTYVQDVGNSYRPGDRICFKLRMNFPANLFTGPTVIRDFLPPGVELDPNQPPVYTAAHTFPTSGPGAWVFDGTSPSIVSWSLNSSPDTSAVFEVYLAAIALDPNAAVSGDILGNLMKVSYKNTGGTSFPLRDQVDVEYVEPQVQLLKGVGQINGGTVNGPNVDNLLVVGGDVVQYRVDLANTGDVDAISTQVWDVLPPGITCAVVSAISSGGTCNAAQNRIEWSAITVPANTASGSLTLTYQVTIPQSFAPGTELPNTAGVRQYQAPTNTGAGSLYTYIPANNIDPTQLSPIASADRDIKGFTAAAHDPSKVILRGATLAKARSTSVDEGGNVLANQATIGEEITYTVTMVVPQGTTIYEGVINDLVPAGQTLLATPAPVFQLNGGALPGGFTTSAAGANPVRLTFPATYTNAAGTGDDSFTLTYTVRVDDVPANGRSASVSNNATFDYKNQAGGTPKPQLAAGTTTTIVEPILAIAKTNDDADGIAEADGYVTYSLTVTNTAGTNVSTAHDVVIRDVLPAGAKPVDGANATLTTDGSVPCPTTNNPSSGVAPGACPSTPLDTGAWIQGANAITWPSIASIPPGSSVTVRYRVRITATELAGASLTNNATTSATTMPGGAPGERTSTAVTSNTLKFISPNVTKAQTPATRTIGEEVTYTLTVVIPAGVRLFDGTLVDTLPDGMNFDAYGAITCTAGCGSTLDAQISPFGTPGTGTPTQNADGSTTVGWYLGDVVQFGTPSPVSRTYELTYTANVDDTYEGTGTPAAGTPVTTGNTLTNAAQLGWNVTDKQAAKPAVPSIAGADGATAVTRTTTTVQEPKLVLNKHVSCNGPDSAPADTETDQCATQPGDGPFTYTITVTNQGNAPAFDIVVDDSPSPNLTNVILTGNASLNTEGWTSADPAMRWIIPGPVAPNASVALSYTAQWRPSAELTNAATAVNTASVPEYFGVPAANRSGSDFFGAPIDYRAHTNVTSDTVTLTIAFPHVTIAKTTAAGNEQNDAEILQPFGWRVVVTNDSTVTARNVTVTDTLPANWTYTSGTSNVLVSNPSFSGGVEPAGGPNGPLTWATGRDLAPGATLTLAFTTVPQPAAISSPGPVHTNTAGATVEDPTGATANTTGAYNGPNDTAVANLLVAALDLQKSPDCGPGANPAGCPPVQAGDTSVPFSIVITNNGVAPARNLVINDVLPQGTIYAGSVVAQLCAPPACTAADLPFSFPTAAPFTELSASAFTADPTQANTPGPGQTTQVYHVATLAPGASVRVRYLADIVSPLVNGTALTNTATVVADEIPGSVADTGEYVVGSKPFWFGVDNPSFKSSVPAPASNVSTEDTITYAVNYTNSGNEIASNVLITDAIPANTTYTAGSATSSAGGGVEFLVGGTYQSSEPADPSQVQGLRWNVGTVTTTAPGNTGTVTFAVKVNKPLDTGTVISNQASLTSDQETALALPPNQIGDPLNQAPLNHTVVSAPDLRLTKAVDSELDTNAEGNRLTYTLTLRNVGTMNAANAVVIDGPPPGTTLVAINSGGAGGLECSTDAGPFPAFAFGPCPADLRPVTQIRWTAPTQLTETTFPTGATRPPLTVGFTVEIPLPALNGTIIPNTASAASDESPPNTYVEASAVSRVASRPVLTLAKSVSPSGVVQSGSTLTYAMNAVNTGTDAAYRVTITDPIPANTRYTPGSASPGAEFLVGGAYQAAEPADSAAVEGLRWRQDSLAMNQAVSHSFAVTVSSTIPLGVTVIDNTATLTGQQRSAGPGGSTSPQTLVTTDLPQLSRSVSNTLRAPALRIVKRGSTRVFAGETGLWQITVTNIGGVTAHKVWVSDALPPGFTLAKHPKGAKIRRGVVTWSIPSLEPGAKTTVTIILRADKGAKGNRINIAAARAADVPRVVRSRAPVIIRASQIAGAGRIPIVTG